MNSHRSGWRYDREFKNNAVALVRSNPPTRAREQGKTRVSRNAFKNSVRQELRREIRRERRQK